MESPDTSSNTEVTSNRLSTSDAFQKAKRAALTYCSLVIVLLVAKTGSTIKMIGIDAEVDVADAVGLLLFAALFYFVGFWIEHLKVMDSGSLSPAGAGSLAAFDEAVVDAGAKASKLFSEEALKQGKLETLLTNEISAATEVIKSHLDRLRKASMHIDRDYNQALADEYISSVGEENQMGSLERHQQVLSEHREAISNFFTESMPLIRPGLADVEELMEELRSGESRLEGELRRMVSNVRTLHKSVHHRDRLTYNFYEVAPVCALFFAANLASLIEFWPPVLTALFRALTALTPASPN